MSKPYERLIHFCEAEMVNPTSKVAGVADGGDFYHIVFPCLHTSINILKPLAADREDREDHAIFGGDPTPYRDNPRFEPLCGMLGLNSPWIGFDKDNPPRNGPYLVSAGTNVWESYIKDGVSWVGRTPHQELSPFIPHYYMPLPAPPID